MRLPSPTNQIVSLHRSTSILGPIEEFKVADSPAGRAFGNSMQDSRDTSDRQPRSSYPGAFFPDPSLLGPSASSRPSSKSMAAATIPSSRSFSGGEESDEDVGSSRREMAMSHSHRKRKSSWPPSDVSRKMSTDQSYYQAASPSQRPGSGGEDVQMNPPKQVASSGLVMSERLPGIAHLDEQMNTPWSIEVARRNANLRSSGGDEHLRRPSGPTFAPPSEARSWRFSGPESNSASSLRGDVVLPSLSQSPRLPAAARRPASPGRSAFAEGDVQPSQGIHPFGGNNLDRMMLYRGGSPSLGTGGALILSRRAAMEQREASPNYRRETKGWQDDKYDAPQLPLTSALYDDHRRRSMMAPPTNRGGDDSFHHSPERRAAEERRAYETSTETAYSGSRLHHRPSDAQSYPYEGPAGLPSERHSFDRRLYERGDSPSYYADEGPGPRHEQSSPHQHHHPYAGPGASTSPTVPRRRGKLPKVVTDLLKTWLLDHASHPYPTEDEKRRLCSVTGLSISQVSNWFINARRRILVPQGSGGFGVGQQQQPQHPGQPMEGQPGRSSRPSSGPPPHHAHPQQHMGSSYSPPSGHHGSHHYQAPPRRTPLPPLLHHHQPSTHHHHHHAPAHSAYAKHEESSHSPKNLSRHAFDDAP